ILCSISFFAISSLCFPIFKEERALSASGISLFSSPFSTHSSTFKQPPASARKALWNHKSRSHKILCLRALFSSSCQALSSSHSLPFQNAVRPPSLLAFYARHKAHQRRSFHRLCLLQSSRTKEP